MMERIVSIVIVVVFFSGVVLTGAVSLGIPPTWSIAAFAALCMFVGCVATAAIAAIDDTISRRCK